MEKIIAKGTTVNAYIQSLYKLIHLVTVGLHTVCGTCYLVLHTVPGTGTVRYCTVPGTLYKFKVINGKPKHRSSAGNANCETFPVYGTHDTYFENTDGSFLRIQKPLLLILV
jgi:hypothetical protein